MSVLVCREKRGDRYFVTPDDKSLFKNALLILRGRLVSDWYEAPGPKPEDLDYVKDDVVSMPKSFQEQAYEKLRKHEDKVREWNLVTAMWDRIQEACSNADGRLAWSILLKRSDYEYETVSLEKSEVQYDYTVKDLDLT
jgi:hypothetical protein